MRHFLALVQEDLEEEVLVEGVLGEADLEGEEQEDSFLNNQNIQYNGKG